MKRFWIFCILFSAFWILFGLWNAITKYYTSASIDYQAVFLIASMLCLLFTAIHNYRERYPK